MFSKNRIFILLTILLPILYGVFVVKNFATPLSTFEGGDVEEWEYVGYFLKENIEFSLLPNLNVDHNKTFYPFGTKQVFLDWSLESNYWYAILYGFFGAGAWLNFYLILSLIISFLGTYLLLKNEFGINKAFFVGFMVTFMNVYALLKYPVHFPHSTIHWTILSIFSDFIIYYKFLSNRKVSLRWVLLKIFLLIAVLGLNIGYVAGYALSNFTLTFLVFIIIVLVNLDKRKKQIIENVNYWKVDFLKHKLSYFLFSIPILIIIYLYLPLIFQIYFEAKKFKIDTTEVYAYWSHPLRLFLPYIEPFNAIYSPLQAFFHDMPEGQSSGSVGWACLIVGIIGFSQNLRKNWLLFLPITLFFLLAILYHPNKIPTLKIFPWFEFNRVGSRFTSIIPIIFGCYFLTANLNFKTYTQRISIILFLLIFSLEFISISKYLSNQKVYFMNESVLKYMDSISNLKGEAVLDFPFCVVGGDGSGLKENLCPVYSKTCGIYAYRRFHHKKVIGGYYSHIPKGELNNMTQSGLGKLIVGNGDWLSSTKINTNFDDSQAEYFRSFYLLNDFCGINLYKDLISEELYKQIINIAGKPKIKTFITGAGEVEFIPKSDSLYQYVDLLKAKRIKFPCGCNN